MKIVIEALIQIGQGKIPCLFSMITGLYCPGCGGTRAVIALIHGRMFQSLLYNPIPVYFLFGGLWCMIKVCLENRKKMNRQAGLPQPVSIFLWGLLTITVGGFLVKNILLITMGIDLHIIAADM